MQVRDESFESPEDGPNWQIKALSKAMTFILKAETLTDIAFIKHDWCWYFNHMKDTGNVKGFDHRSIKHMEMLMVFQLQIILGYYLSLYSTMEKHCYFE